jgi:L-ascorbate metabolism protein UlaG (beta-lactamase superfamily)
MKYKNIELKWLGHSGFLIQNGKTIYIDPFRISEDLPQADMILITHSHYDHCSIEDIKKIARDGTIIICTADSQSKFSHIDLKLDIKLIEVGSEIEFDEGNEKVWAVPAYNLNKTFHEKAEDWVGYILELGEINIYHAGDTDNIPEMKHIQEIDIALLPIGGTITMNAGEAANAAIVIKPKLAIPMHFGTIVGSRGDAEIFVRQCSAGGVDAKILDRE